MKIKFLTKKEKELNENWKSCGVRMGLVSPDNEQATQLASCRDYFNDAIWAQVNQKPVEIYGFSYDPNLHPSIDLENTRLLLRLSAKWQNKQDNILNFLNQIETELHISLSQLHKTNRKSNYIIVADKLWMHAPPLISLFTLLIRIGASHEIDNNWRDTFDKIFNSTIPVVVYDDRRLGRAGLALLDLLKEEGFTSAFGSNIAHNYQPYFDLLILHNQFGIYGYQNSYSKPAHWKVPTTKVSTKIVDEDYYNDNDD